MGFLEFFVFWKQASGRFFEKKLRKKLF